MSTAQHEAPSLGHWVEVEDRATFEHKRDLMEREEKYKLSLVVIVHTMRLSCRGLLGAAWLSYVLSAQYTEHNSVYNACRCELEATWSI